MKVAFSFTTAYQPIYSQPKHKINKYSLFNTKHVPKHAKHSQSDNCECFSF